MTTELVFRAFPYAHACDARVVALDEKGVILDRTVFYATSGGQPGDSGRLIGANGEALPVANAVFVDPAKTIIAHVLGEGATPPAIGETLRAEIDAEPRMKRMRMHTALHLLSVVLPFPVTGGAVGAEEARLDFDLPEMTMTKEEIAAALNGLIAREADVRDRMISEAELDANPGLVKTMSVQPPRGAGSVRLVEIAGLDLQPCGGTHVRNTREIGPVKVTQIEKKGKQNRRVRIAFA